MGIGFSSGIRFRFVYPNRDEVECSAAAGDLLYDVALKNGIQMDLKVKQSCLVQIEVPTKEGGFVNEMPIKEATDLESADLTPAQISNRFRYANTYTVDEHLAGASIFLNLIRVIYKDRNNNEHVMHAVATESLMSLRDRNSNIIDLSFSCHGALACSTCHCVFDVSNDTFKALGSISNDEEDLMYYCNPEDHSRLGCQVQLKPEFDKIRFRHPKAKNV